MWKIGVMGKILVTHGRNVIVLVADGRSPLSFTRSEVVKIQAAGCNRVKYSWFNSVMEKNYED